MEVTDTTKEEAVEMVEVANTGESVTLVPGSISSCTSVGVRERLVVGGIVCILVLLWVLVKSCLFFVRMGWHGLRAHLRKVRYSIVALYI